jgi:hypothetical protein
MESLINFGLLCILGILVKQMTTVKVRRETKKMLADMGKKEDTYDDVIMRLIEFYNKNSKETERKHD